MKTLYQNIGLGLLGMHALTASLVNGQTVPDRPAVRVDGTSVAFQPLMLGVSSWPVDAYRPGLEVEHVLAGGPAAAAGIRLGDILLAFDDQRLFHPWQLRGLTNGQSVGDRIQLKYLRAGKSHTANVTLTRWTAGAVAEPDQGAGSVGLDALPVDIQSQVLKILNRDRQAGPGKSALVPRPLPLPNDASGADIKVSYQSINLDKGDIRIAVDDGQNGLVGMINGKLHLVVKNKEGAVTFRGFCHTAEEIDALPMDFQNALRTLNTLDFRKHIQVPKNQGSE